MNVHYPIMLNLAGKKVVVVGGGRVAERKVASLLETRARILLVSPVLTEELQSLANQGIIDWRKKEFTKEDLKEAVLIFAATNDEKVNEFIRTAANSNQLVNIADDPDGSSFHVPSHFHRGRLTIAVSTGGASPILASQIREQLEQEYNESYEDYLEFLFVTRRKIIKEVKDPIIKRKLLKAITSPELLTSNNREEDFSKLYQELL